MVAPGVEIQATATQVSLDAKGESEGEKPKKGKGKKKKKDEEEGGEEGACALRRSRVAVPAARSDILRRTPPSAYHPCSRGEAEEGQEEKGTL